MVMGLFAGAMVLPADTFDFSYDGPGVIASGTLTAIEDGGGQYTVTGISGTRNGSQITGILPAGSDGKLVWDNLLFLGGGGLVDSAGLGFSVQGISGPVNVCWGNVPTSAVCEYNNVLVYNEFTEPPAGGYTSVALNSFTVTAVPESAPALAGLLLGLVVLGGRLLPRASRMTR